MTSCPEAFDEGRRSYINLVNPRRMLLNRAAAEQARVLAYHFDFPGLGYVQRHQELWKWQPIVATTD